MDVLNYHVEKSATAGRTPYTLFETIVGKTSSYQIGSTVARVLTCVTEREKRDDVMTKILQTLETRKAGLFIPIRTQTVTNERIRDLVGKEEYENPEPGSTYWNSNWIVGSCACLFC